MVKIGKNYELYFGKNIFIKYSIININWELEWAELKINDEKDFYSKYEYIELKLLKSKRKIINWNYPTRQTTFNNLSFFSNTHYEF